MAVDLKHVIGIVGRSGSGKTTLLSDLIPLLKARGYSVSTIKHTHHGFDMDKPGKDSYRHREAGASEVLLTSANRWALLHELRGEDEPPLEDLLERMSPVDIVLVEGFKSHPFPKVEVHRPALGHVPLAHKDKSVVAMATDGDVQGIDAVILDLNCTKDIADFIIGQLKL